MSTISQCSFKKQILVNMVYFTTLLSVAWQNNTLITPWLSYNSKQICFILLNCVFTSLILLQIKLNCIFNYKMHRYILYVLYYMYLEYTVVFNIAHLAWQTVQYSTQWPIFIFYTSIYDLRYHSKLKLYIKCSRINWDTVKFHWLFYW